MEQLGTVTSFSVRVGNGERGGGLLFVQSSFRGPDKQLPGPFVSWWWHDSRCGGSGCPLLIIPLRSVWRRGNAQKSEKRDDATRDLHRVAATRESASERVLGDGETKPCTSLPQHLLGAASRQVS